MARFGHGEVWRGVGLGGCVVNVLESDIAMCVMEYGVVC